MADDVYFFEQGVNATAVGDLSHLAITKHLRPVVPLVARIKDEDEKDEHNAFANFLLGTTYYASRAYIRAVPFLRAAADTFDSQENQYDALVILAEVFARRRCRGRWRRTMVEAMQLMPRKNYAFEQYADAVARRSGATGINTAKKKEVVHKMRAILAEHSGIQDADRSLLQYIVGLSSEYRTYPPIYAL